MVDKLKIAQVVCKYPPYKSGIGNVALEETKRLAQDTEVMVFSLDKNLKPWLKMGNGGFVPQLLWRLRNFDIIQLHYPFFGAQEVIWLGKILGILKKPKLVIYYHMDAVLNNRWLKLLNLPSKIIGHNLFRLADKVLCSTFDYVANSRIKHFFQKYKDKFIEAPFGSQFVGDQRQTTDNLQQTTDNLQQTTYNRQLTTDNQRVKKILFVGGLDKAHYFKGVDVLINAVKMLGMDFKLIIAGGGGLKPQYEQMVRELKLEDKIEFFGPPTDEQMGELHSRADLFVLPSINSAEAFGIVLLDAKSFGKAVVASDLPGVRQVVANDKAGLTARPGDYKDLADKIKKLLENDELRYIFGQEGLKQVKELYNWERHVSIIKEVYENLCYK